MNTDLNQLKCAYGIIANHQYKKCAPFHPKSWIILEYEYGVCCRTVGDVIDMYVDLDNYRMRFAINDKNYGYIYKDEIEQTEYAIGMTLSKVEIAIELVSYQKIQEIPNE